MAKKEQRISVNAFERVFKEEFSDTVTKQWRGIDVEIKRILPLRDMMEFVNDITELCFISDGSFVPEVLDFAVKRGILTRYANFSMPDNIEKQYALVCGTDAADMVRNHVSQSQITEIISSAERKIEHMCDYDIVEQRGKLESLYNAFVGIGKQMSDAFSDIDPDEFKNMVSAIGNGSVDEEKIVSAYLKHAASEETEDA